MKLNFEPSIKYFKTQNFVIHPFLNQLFVHITVWVLGSSNRGAAAPRAPARPPAACGGQCGQATPSAAEQGLACTQSSLRPRTPPPICMGLHAAT